MKGSLIKCDRLGTTKFLINKFSLFLCQGKYMNIKGEEHFVECSFISV